jgi:hypothetical protein
MFCKILKNTVAAGNAVKAGDVVELGEYEANELLAMGRVIFVDEPKKKAAPKRATRVVEDLETPEGE